MTYFFMLLQWLTISPGSLYFRPRARKLLRQVEAPLTDAQWNYVFNLDSCPTTKAFISGLGQEPVF